MLKFFRRYNKVILIFGASLLMVAFLIQPVMSMFRPDPTSTVLGEMGDQPVTRGDKLTAANELRVLKHLPPLGQLIRDDSLRWLLLIHDARRMGLSASNYEVEQALSLIAGSRKEQVLQRMVMNLRVKKAFIDQAVRHWIMAQQYRDLMLGTGYRATSISVGRGAPLIMGSPALQRLGTMAQVMGLRRQAQQAKDPSKMFMARQRARLLAIRVQRTHRLSAPLIQHVIQDQRATISGKVLVIGAGGSGKAGGAGAQNTGGSAGADTPAPGEARLRELFQRYRDTPPGQGEPYHIGYRIPDRVKLQYLAIPIGAVTDTIQVDETDAVEYYQQHKSRYQLPPAKQGGKPTQQPYQAVRKKVIQRLTRQQARDKTMKMVRAATASLVSPQRRLPTGPKGYKQVPEDFKPVSMKQVAAELAKRFGVQPRVHDDTGQWVAMDQAKALPGIGQSSLADRSRIGFTDYLATARGLKPSPDNPLTSLRLQAHILSLPMRDQKGSMYLFRLQNAQGAHPPKSLDAVRGKVAQDARQIAAYHKLVKAKGRWLGKARKLGIKKLAGQAPGAVVNQVGPIPRGSFGATSARSLPEVPGLGKSKAFIDQAFALAQRLSDHGKVRDLDKMPRAKRVIAVPVPERLSLAVFRLDSYQPLTRTQYQKNTTALGAEVFVDNSIEPANAVNPLSLQSLKRRMKYHEAGQPVPQPTPKPAKTKQARAGA